jgi:hypothetical protein
MPIVIVPPGLAAAAAPPEGVTAAEVELVPEELADEADEAADEAEEAADELEELDPHPAASAATTTAVAATPQNRGEREFAAEGALLWLIGSRTPWLGVGVCF